MNQFSVFDSIGVKRQEPLLNTSDVHYRMFGDNVHLRRFCNTPLLLLIFTALLAGFLLARVLPT